VGEGGREFFELNKRFFRPKIRILLRAITGYDSAKQGDIFRPKEEAVRLSHSMKEREFFGKTLRR
jgi:hypothetical protein